MYAVGTSIHKLICSEKRKYVVEFHPLLAVYFVFSYMVEID